MARRPSQRTIEIYNSLVEKQNEVRRRLKRIHAHAEEAFGAGRLPSLIVPPKAKKIRTNYFNDFVHKHSRKQVEKKLSNFWETYRQSKSLFGQGLRSYLSRVVKQGYVDLWKDQMLTQLGIWGEGYAGRFTEIQIKEASESDKKFMLAFNRMISLPAEMFYIMLMRKEIIQFQFIYQEMTYGYRDKENSWIDQQLSLFEKNRSWKKQVEAFRAGNLNYSLGFKDNTVYETLERDKNQQYRERGRRKSAGTRHSAETIAKAERRAKR